MGKRQTIIRSLLTGILTLGLLAVAPLAQATTVADVCNTSPNMCSGGVASINVTTIVTCPLIDFGQDETVLDFVAAGFPFVQINTGATLKAENIPRCSLTLIVGDLLVKLGGKLNVDKTVNNTPGTVKVIASDTIRVDRGGRITAIGGKQTAAHPTIDLLATNDISIAGIVEARGTSAIGNGGHILIESTAGLVTIEGTGNVKSKSTDPGGTLIRITACLGIEIFGTVDATSKKRQAVLELFSREGILIDGGKVQANIQIGELDPSDIHIMTIQARTDIIVRQNKAVISAYTKSTNKKGGTINILSTEGAFLCEAGDVKADSINGGSDGGFIDIQAFNDVLYDCDISAKGSKFNNGVGGVVALQSFQQDVLGSGKIDVSAANQGNIILTACANPITDGGSFSALPVLVAGQCENSPLTIPACVPTQPDACIDLEKEISVDGGITFFDADNPGDPDVPLVSVPSGALYRLIVTNCGTEDLENVLINDPVLNIVDFFVGDLAVGTDQTLTEGDIPELNVVQRCSDAGTFINVASTSGQGKDSGDPVMDSDPAIIECEGQPNIEIIKQISVDGGATFADADSPGDPDVSTIPLGSSVLYRLIVRNTGTQDLENVFINDPVLNIAGFFVGDLAVGAEITLTEGDIPALAVADRCTTTGTFINVAIVFGSEVGTGDQVTDSDPAVVECTGQPNIEIVKEVSVDGGATYVDANDAGSAPTVPLGNGVLYRLIVRNIGVEDLVNVEIDDPVLGIVGFVVGNLAVGQEVILTEGQIPELEVTDRCPTPGTVTNVAIVTGDGATSGDPVTDSDPAVVECIGQPDIEIVKEVSVDGGATYVDANDVGSAPTIPLNSGVLYRITVRNIGAEDLVNVEIDDATLGIVGFVVGNLAVGQEVILTEGQIPELEVANRCATPGTITNVAVVIGDGTPSGDPVTDSDPAVVECEGQPNIEIVKEVSVDGGATYVDANSSGDPDVPTIPLGSGVLYRITVRNIGATDLANVLINDPILGIAGFFIGDLLVGAEVILTEGQIPALEVANRCETPGTVTNVALVFGQEVGTGDQVTDSDPAVVECEGQPNIEIVKEVSVDGGATFLDANDAGSAPIVPLGNGVFYRLIVRNIGVEDLVNVEIDDPILGIVGFVVGNLAVGQEVILTEGQIPELEVVDRCQTPGTVTNVAIATGDGATSGDPVTDSDPAVVECTGQPDIEIVKEVSVDGGVTFFDANDVGSAPVVSLGNGVLYRFIVRNIGVEDLVNVEIDDPILGIVGFVVGNLAVGQEVILTEVEIPELEVTDRCPTPGTVTNVAIVTGDGTPSGDPVTDSDPAVVECQQDGICLVIIDEDGLDNNMSTIEDAAAIHGTTSQLLLNEDKPTKVGNPPLRWNTMFPGDVVLLSPGRVNDEGWFAPPPNPPWPLADFAAGVLPQDQLDKINDVMPLRNQELVRLIGRTCVAIVYDSDISINFDPLQANLQGERLGAFSFTVLAIEVPGSIAESTSDTSLYDLWLRIESPLVPTEGFDVEIHEHVPDSIEIIRANFVGTTLDVRGSTDSFGPCGGPGPGAPEDFRAFMTVTVDGPDAGTDPNVNPFILEVPMTLTSGDRCGIVLKDILENLDGRRVTISTDEGGAYNDVVR